MLLKLLLPLTSASPVEATREVAASMIATQPVEDPNTKMRVAAWPVEGPGARSEVHSQPKGTGSRDVRPIDQSLTSKKTVPVAATSVSDSDDDLDNEPDSSAGVSDQDELSDRDNPKDEELDHVLSEEANYQETMRGVRPFMGLYQVPDFDSSSSSLDDNPFDGPRGQPTGKVSIKLPADDWLCRKLEKLNVTMHN